MAMWTVIIKNSSGGDVTIEDLGIIITDATQITASDQYTYPDLAESDNLRTLVAAGTLVVNDGVSDLSVTDGVDFLTIIQREWVQDNYWSQTELSSTGGASDRVDWSQIQNAPSFGSVNWLEPVLARILEVADAAPSGVDGDFYIDSTSGVLYKYDSGWGAVANTPAEGQRVINFDSTSENILEYTSGVWVEQIKNIDSDAVIVNDDGDTRPAMYVFDIDLLPAGQWLKIADADILTSGNTLDQAYDQGGSGVGRTITADSGAVQITAGGGYAPLDLGSPSSAATTGLAEGQIQVISGLMYAYDGTRSKWLSVQRMTLVFGRKGNTKEQFLNFGSGSLASNNSGYRIPRNATIVSLAGQLDASGTSNLRVRKNDAAANIATLAVTAAVGASDNTVNVDLTADEFIQAYCSNTVSVEDPILIVEIAWRA